MIFVRQYGKFLAQIVFAALTALVAAQVDNRVDAGEWINVLIVALGAVAVLGAGNLPSGVWAYTKTIVSGATAAATLLVAFLSDGGMVTGSEWIQVLLAAMAALGVAFAPAPKVYDAMSVARLAANGPTR
jgi:hypothetical protein